MPAIFITGTDTGVGKTFVATHLIRALRNRGLDCAGIKPFCCGERTDAERLAAAADHCEPLDTVNPVWFRAPLAPWAASMVEQRQVDLDLAKETIQTVCARRDWVVVEGAGGWLVPVTEHWTLADLVVDWGLPVLVVAADRLGVLNHTLLTVESIVRHQAPLVGTVLNRLTAEESDASRATNSVVLEMAQSPRLLGVVEPDEEALASSIVDSILETPERTA